MLRRIMSMRLLSLDLQGGAGMAEANPTGRWRTLGLLPRETRVASGLAVKDVTGRLSHPAAKISPTATGARRAGPVGVPRPRPNLRSVPARDSSDHGACPAGPAVRPGDAVRLPPPADALHRAWAGIHINHDRPDDVEGDRAAIGYSPDCPLGLCGIAAP